MAYRGGGQGEGGQHGEADDHAAGDDRQAAPLGAAGRTLPRERQHGGREQRGDHRTAGADEQR
ncbi:hypothetical protein LUW77_01900 [Streptomyces radiopugnans]|nr:hypothetical protein LUW77_01900 [Streptomyces radiopugnans]